MSDVPDETLACLEDASGRRTPIRGFCAIGRSPSNQLTLASERVSRRHAIIQAQHENEFWLVDFGSRNGTYLNSRRITMPQRLQHGDRLTIGPFEFVFRLRESRLNDRTSTLSATMTAADIRQARCWLLVADIIGSSRLVRELPPDELPLVTGRWLSGCRQTIEEHQGSVNQFFGDGFLAYWRDTTSAHLDVAATLKAFRQMQEQARPGFRVVVHYGDVVLGGMSLGEEERISGKEVHFTFRMEKLAGKLGEAGLLSHAAWERLAPCLTTRPIGNHTLPGFDSAVMIHAF